MTPDVINSLMDLLARKALNGMEMKVDDDLTFEMDYREVAMLHEMYWEDKNLQLGEFVELYEAEMEAAQLS